MLQFPIRWTTGTDAITTVVPLNHGWEIIFSATNHTVEFRRKVTSEEVCIFGRLSIQNLKRPYYIGERQMQVTQEFARFMESGSSSLVIKFDNLVSNPSRRKYHLDGDINIFEIIKKCTGECEKCIHMKSLVELSNEFGAMLDPHTCCFADVKLKCGSESIPVHKSVLSARSPVFAAMFKNPMRESHENEVDINDVDAPVLRIMLTYIYTGKAPDLTVSSASDLLFIADKYQLQDLKRVCCDFLKANFSLQNVLGILVLGDLHSEIDLKSCAINYIYSNSMEFSDLEETEEWKTVMKERPTLAEEILTSLGKSRDDK